MPLPIVPAPMTPTRSIACIGQPGISRERPSIMPCRATVRSRAARRRRDAVRPASAAHRRAAALREARRRTCRPAPAPSARGRSAAGSSTQLFMMPPMYACSACVASGVSVSSGSCPPRTACCSTRSTCTRQCRRSRCLRAGDGAISARALAFVQHHLEHRLRARVAREPRQRGDRELAQRAQRIGVRGRAGVAQHRLQRQQSRARTSPRTGRPCRGNASRRRRASRPPRRRLRRASCARRRAARNTRLRGVEQLLARDRRVFLRPACHRLDALSAAVSRNYFTNSRDCMYPFRPRTRRTAAIRAVPTPGVA